MAEVEISEFSFGYAFLFEQTQANWGNLKIAPVLPSLQKEAEKGWDARLPLRGTDYYYQFKRSDYLRTRNATYRIKPNSKHPEDCIYDGPYYRFWLHPKNNSQQHRRLREHCLEKPDTYYVAPEFNSIEEFNAQFLDRQIRVNSRMIPLSQCEDITDSKHHCITFQRGSPNWIFHSEPRRHEKSFTGGDLEDIYRRSSNRWQVIDLGFAENLFERTREIAKKVIALEEPHTAFLTRPLLDEAPVGHERHNLLLRTADILSATLGLTLVLVGSRE